MIIKSQKTIIGVGMVASLFLTACSKNDEDTSPTSATVTAVKIATFPLSDQGAQWDVGSDADVYFTIESNNNVLFTFNKSNCIDNVTASDLPLYFNLSVPYQLSVLNQVYYIGIYDYDNLSTDDLIARLPFNPDEFKEDRPATKKVMANDALVEVSFNWE